jgi:3',5'-cyclic AMP phosphodiesterase CpdA
VGAAATVVAGGSARMWLYEKLRWGEDFFPGEPPRIDLEPKASAPWKVALMHHPAHSSGAHGSELRVRDAVQPLLSRHGVHLAFAGHDHHYERTHPQDGVVWVVSGAGCKRTGTGFSEFTTHAESTLQFMLVSIDGTTADVRAVTTDGRVIDRVVLDRRTA